MQIRSNNSELGNGAVKRKFHEQRTIMKLVGRFKWAIISDSWEAIE